MNLSEQMSILFSCNVSPSEMPQLNIGATKREPLAIAVPMTILYTTIFLLGVWTCVIYSTHLTHNTILPSELHWYMRWLYTGIDATIQYCVNDILTANHVHTCDSLIKYKYAPQVLFNGVSILTLLMDAHMRASAIRFYLLSLVISGTAAFTIMEDQWPQY